MTAIHAKIRQRLSRDLENLTSRSGNITYAQACNRNADDLPDRVAIVDRRNRLNWAAVKTQSDRLALGLMERGIIRPDVAMIHLPNGIEQFLIRLACEKAGVRVALTSTWFRESELLSIIEQTRPRIAFISANQARTGAYDRLREMIGTREIDVRFVSVGDGPGVSWADSWDDFYKGSPTGPADGLLDRTRFRFDERFYLATTSGSTSAPKITDVIFGNRIRLSLMHAAGVKLGIGGTIAALPPITSGTSDTLVHHAAPYFAAKTVLETRFDAVPTTVFLVTEDVQIATVVPTMLARMVATGAIDNLHDAPLNCFAVYASALSYDLAMAIEERGRCETVRCYGTMDYGGISMSTLDDPRDRRIKSVGKPFTDNDVKIIDQDGNSLPAGVEGEVAIRPGRYSMGGYYRNPSLTAEAWSGDYYRLGDLAIMDEDGYITLVGRAQELIIRGGQNIVPAEVEELVTAHEAVVDVAVIGVPDAEMGERVCACLIVADGVKLSLKDLRAHFDQLGVAQYKCPERIAILDEFPMTQSGIKIDRRKLAELVSG